MPNTPFARLGKSQQKEANIQSTIDGAWNGIRDNVVNPAVKGVTDTVGGIGSTIGGAAKAVGNTVAAPFKAVAGGLNGLAEGSGQGLGGALQGAYDGAGKGWDGAMHDLGANSRQMDAGIAQAGNGLAALGVPEIASGVAGITPAAIGAGGLGSLSGTMSPPSATGGLKMPGAIPAGAASVGAPAPAPTAQTPGPIGALKPAPPAAQAAAQQMSPSPAYPKATPVPGNPMNDAIARFRGAHGTAYDPHSSMDRRKLQAMMPKSAAWIRMEKRAGLPGGLVQKGLAAGEGLFNKARTTVKGLRAGAETGLPKKLPSLGGAGDAALTIGGLGGAGVIGHHMGQSSGREQGVAEGVDAGLQRGVSAATAAQPGDPGVLGRLLDVFRGQQSGPDAPSILSNLQTDKDALIKSILAGRPA